jgi:hypothetical protein
LSRFFYPLLAVALVAYLSLACYRLWAIPLGYDELLFCNAALDGIDPDLFNFVKVGNVPVLLMDYIGALKAWLYWPIFKLFGVSVWSIRLPVVLLTAGGLWWLAGVVRREWGAAMAVLVAFLLALDASFVHYTRFDTGPNAIELFLKIATVAGWLRFVATGRVRYVVGVGGALLLGLFNKLNFVWYINAFYAGLAVGYGRWLFDWVGQQRRTEPKAAFKGWGVLFVLGLTYLLTVTYLLVINHLFNVFGQKIGNETGLTMPFVRVFGLLTDVLGGSGLATYTYWFGFGGWPQWLFAVQPWVAALLLGMSGLVAVGLLWRARLVGPLAAHNRLFLLSAVVLFALLAQLFVTERARFGWHIFMVYPFATLSGTYAIRLLWSWLAEELTLSATVRQTAVLGTFGSWLGLVVAAQCTMVLGLHRQPFQYGAAIHELIAYTRPLNQQFVIVGGACTTQLITMTQQPDKYYEQAYLFGVTHKFLTIRAKDHAEFYQKYLTKPGEYRFIDTTNPMPRGTVVNYRDFHCRPFLDVAGQYGVRVVVEKEIRGSQDGYRIYRVVGIK